MTVKHMRVCVPACVSARARGTGVFGLRSVTRSSTLIFSTRLLIPMKFPDEYSARRFDARSHSLWCMHVCEFVCTQNTCIYDRHAYLMIVWHLCCDHKGVHIRARHTCACARSKKHSTNRSKTPSTKNMSGIFSQTAPPRLTRLSLCNCRMYASILATSASSRNQSPSMSNKKPFER